MGGQTISLDAVRFHRLAILGYGNQGRAQALNLRDSGVEVLVGVRPGKSAELARQDGFEPLSFEVAVEGAEIVMFLLPDQVISGVYQELLSALSKEPKFLGFSHGFVYHFRLIERLPNCSYFLVAPRGPGAVLRERFTQGKSLPGVFALGEGAGEEVRSLCQGYGQAIGVGKRFFETTFREETLCDLFGEQAVLCGGILELMEQAFEVLVARGMQPEMAFMETCYEIKAIAELLLKYGPYGMTEQISPTAFFGGLTRGRRLVTKETKRELEKIYSEIENGGFTAEWLKEVDKGMPQLKKRREDLKGSALQSAFEKLKDRLSDE